MSKDRTRDGFATPNYGKRMPRRSDDSPDELTRYSPGEWRILETMAGVRGWDYTLQNAHLILAQARYIDGDLDAAMTKEEVRELRAKQRARLAALQAKAQALRDKLRSPERPRAKLGHSRRQTRTPRP